MAQNVRVPPQNIEMEQALLGALMLNQNAMYEVADIVGVDSFYAGKHRTIFDAMLSLYSKGEPIDVVTISGKLKQRKLLSEVGGASYLSELVGAAASPGSARHYAQGVQTKFVLRSLIDAAAKIGELGFEEDRDIEIILDEAQSAVFSVTQTPMLRSFSAIKDELAEAWERLEILQKEGSSIRGIPTGFPQLDSLLAGLQKSDLIILAARPSMGKTALALDIARQTATKHGTAVGIFSLEMSSQQLVDRMLAAQAGVNAWRLRTGKIKDEDEFERLQQGMGVLAEAPIYIDDKASTTVLAMRSVARRLKMEKDLRLIIVDYLQLITPTYARGADNLVQQVTEISRSLKAMARELEVPVLALSQLSRAVETRRGRPRLSDLRDSGCLAGDTIIINAKTGERHTMRDLAERAMPIPLPVHTTDDSMVTVHETTRVFHSGRKQIFRLTIHGGRSIKASANHKFLTTTGWRRLDELAPHTRVAIPARERVPKTVYAFIDASNIIYGAGADGWKMDFEKLIAYLRGRYGVTKVFFYGGEDSANEAQRNFYNVLVHLGYTLCLVPMKTFSDGRKKADVDSRMTFDMMRFAAEYDRAVVMTGDGDFYWMIEHLVNTKERVWLLSFPNRTARELKRLVGSDFADINGMRAFLERAQKGTDSTNESAPGFMRQSYSSTSKMSSAFGKQEKQEKLAWRSIQSIVPLGEEDVYDATVPGVHNFVANDIIVHNSIEQDADVVMFIHRDDKMNENSDRPGIAEILVEKHRNGPVGKIDLRFDEEKTTFRSIEKSDFGDFTPETEVEADSAF